MPHPSTLSSCTSCSSMKPNGFFEPNRFGQAEAHEALIGDELQVLHAASAVDRPAHAVGQHVLDEQHLAVDGLDHHLRRSGAASSASNRSGSSRRTVSTTSKAKSMCPLSSRNTQLVPAARPLSRPFERRKYT